MALVLSIIEKSDPPVPKCDKCLRGAIVRTTGANPSNTLKIDIGGAIVYVMPEADGKIEVALNAQNLFMGDYVVSTWDGERWIITSMQQSKREAR